MLTISWRRPLSYRNQSIGLLRKSMDWFLYDNGLCHERVNSSVIYQVSSSKPISAQRCVSALRFTGSYMKCNAGIKWVHNVPWNYTDWFIGFIQTLQIHPQYKEKDFFGTGWKCVNLFHGTCLGIYSKTPENIWFSDVFRGYIERDQWHETGYYA